MAKNDLKAVQRQKMANISGSGKNYEYPGDKAVRFSHGDNGNSVGITSGKSRDSKDEDKD